MSLSATLKIGDLDHYQSFQDIQQRQQLPVFADNNQKSDFGYTWEHEYMLVGCQYLSERESNGVFPTTKTLYHITVILVAPEDQDFYEWYTNHDVKSGRIEIVLSGKNATEINRYMNFYDADLVSLKEEYDINNRRYLTLELITDRIKLD